MFSLDVGGLCVGVSRGGCLRHQASPLAELAEPRLDGCHGVVWWGTRPWVFFGTSNAAPRSLKCTVQPHAFHFTREERVPFLIGFSARWTAARVHHIPPSLRSSEELCPSSPPYSIRVILSFSFCFQGSHQSTFGRSTLLDTEHDVVTLESAPDPSPVCEELHGAEEQPHASRRLARPQFEHNPSGFAAIPARFQPSLLPAVVVACPAR